MVRGGTERGVGPSLRLRLREDATAFSEPPGLGGDQAEVWEQMAIFFLMSLMTPGPLGEHANTLPRQRKHDSGASQDLTCSGLS